MGVLEPGDELQRARSGRDNQVRFAVRILANECLAKLALCIFFRKETQFETLKVELDLIRRLLQSREDGLIDLGKAG